MEKKNHLSGFYHEHHHDDECGCGHDHEHHHHDGEECGCGHDHEHHHHDGDECGCGHDHEHHHHDGDECGCGHDHEHHHHDGEECGCGHHHKKDKVMIGKMSGHTLGTITCYSPATLPISELNMNLSMKDVNIYIREQGGIPMQLKASLKDNTTTVVMNMIGKDIIRAEGHDDNGIEEGKVKVNLLVICDGIADDVLKDRLEELMSYFVNNSF